jgi:hypothetical protein
VGSVAPALATVVVVAAVLRMPAASGAVEPQRVLMYGDSVMLGARAQLLAQFAGMPVTVDAVEDRSLLGAIGTFQASPGGAGDVVVLDLGYNDSDDPAVFRGRIDSAMTALAGAGRVIWLNQHEFTGGRAAMNAELAAAAGRYSNLDVVDWNAEVAAHPDDVYADAIHLTPAGQVAMAALVRQRFDQYAASLRPTTTTSPATEAPTTPAPGAGAAARPEAARAGGRSDDTSRRDVRIGVVAVTIVVVLAGTAILLVRRRTVRS